METARARARPRVASRPPFENFAASSSSAAAAARGRRVTLFISYSLYESGNVYPRETRFSREGWAKGSALRLSIPSDPSVELTTSAGSVRLGKNRRAIRVGERPVDEGTRMARKCAISRQTSRMLLKFDSEAIRGYVACRFFRYESFFVMRAGRWRSDKREIFI